VPYGAHSGDGILNLKVTVSIPGQGPYSITLDDAEPPKCVGKLSCAMRRRPVSLAVYSALRQTRDYFGITMESISVMQQGRQQQRLILH
jgi:hypothetical protein